MPNKPWLPDLLFELSNEILWKNQVSVLRLKEVYILNLFKKNTFLSFEMLLQLFLLNFLLPSTINFKIVKF